MKKLHQTYLLMLLIMLCISAVSIQEVIVGGGVLSDENGFLENISAFSFLFASVLLFFRTIYTNGFERRLTFLFAMTSLLFFVREVDLEDQNIPYLLKLIGHGLGRDLLFSFGFLTIVSAIVIKDKTNFSEKFRSCLKSPVSHLVLLGVGGILLGSIFETIHSEFAEELCEMNGSLLILLASLTTLHQPIYSPAR